MLQKTNRLCKKKEIDGVFRRGKSVKEGNLTLKAAKNQLDSVRFCFVVSKRVSKTAVGRNLIKRRMREISKAVLPCLKPGYDLIFIVGPGFEKLDYRCIAEVMEKTFLRAGLMIAGKI
jgi:ribonuclease P protein component